MTQVLYQAHIDIKNNPIPNTGQFGAAKISGEKTMAAENNTSIVTAKEFAEELYGVQSWYELGIFLGAPVEELNRIKTRNEGIVTNLAELFTLMKTQRIPLTWDKIIDALEKLKNHQLASQIRQNHMTGVQSTISDNPPMQAVEQYLPNCSGLSLNLHQGHVATPSMTPTQSSLEPFSFNTPSSSSSQDPTNGESNEESEHIHNPIPIYLDHGYVKKIQSAQILLSVLQTSIINGLKREGIDVSTLQMIIISYFDHYVPLPDETAMIAVFERVRKGCSHEEYVQFLENIVNAYLDDDETIKTKLKVYEQHCESLVSEQPLRDIVGEIPPHTGSRAVWLKLPPSYENVPIKKFDAFNRKIFKRTYPHLSNMRVTKGCICVSWIVTDIKEVIEDTHESWDLLATVGVISVSVGGKVIFKGSQEQNGACCSEEMVVDEGYHSVMEAFDLKNWKNIKPMDGINPI